MAAVVVAATAVATVVAATVVAAVVSAVVVERLDGPVVLGVVAPAAAVAAGVAPAVVVRRGHRRGGGGGCRSGGGRPVLAAVFTPVLAAAVDGLADDFGPHFGCGCGRLGSGLRLRRLGATRRKRDGGEQAEGDDGDPGCDLMT
jgi:hypothetical protein